MGTDTQKWNVTKTLIIKVRNKQQSSEGNTTLLCQKLFFYSPYIFNSKECCYLPLSHLSIVLLMIIFLICFADNGSFGHK